MSVLEIIKEDNILEAKQNGETLDILQSKNVVEISNQFIGPPGPAGDIDGVVKSRIAGENIGGQRIVVTNNLGEVIIGDQSNLSHLGLFTGITKTSVTTGASVQVISYGTLIDGSFSFTPEAKIYFGTNGIITQTPPTSGFLQSIGHAVSATEIFINPQIPIEL